MNTPIIETEGFQGSREVRLDARFLKERKLFLIGEINSESALELTQKLIFLENDPAAEPIKLYINSPGGEITSGLLIYDVLQGMTKEVDLYCLGMAASMAAVILASGKKGHRHILPHSKTMIHEPLIGSSIGADQQHRFSIFRTPSWIQRGWSMKFLHFMLARRRKRSIRQHPMTTT